MLETQFSHHLIAQIKLQGIFAYKTSDRHQIGLPDIYITGGTWIESKVERWRKRKEEYKPQDWVELPQHSWLSRLHRSGDRAIVAFRMATFGGKADIIIVPYPVLMQSTVWKGARLESFAVTDFSTIFKKGEPGNVRAEWYNQTV